MTCETQTLVEDIGLVVDCCSGLRIYYLGCNLISVRALQQEGVRQPGTLFRNYAHRRILFLKVFEIKAIAYKCRRWYERQHLYFYFRQNRHWFALKSSVSWFGPRPRRI